MGKRLGIFLHVVGIGLIMMIVALSGCGSSGNGIISGGTSTLYIIGNPSTTAIVGNAYSFTPFVGGTDANNLTFSITTVSPATLPAWLTFNPQTGTLSGTPGASDVGVISGIVISVSNGATFAPLPAFTLTVTATGSTGSSGGTP
ncbi:MAG TPA: putative Ig domain-containing protein [Nitrospirota bacterium]|nr:putative Ig domain-containing protein [Nitrospirota bacterium]